MLGVDRPRSILVRASERVTSMRVAIAGSCVCACIVLLAATVSAMADTKLEVTSFEGATSLPMWVAVDRGFFARYKLDVAVSRAHGAIGQMQDMMAGKYQIALTAMDNIAGYSEGQADVKLAGFDVFAFAGLYSSAEFVIARPEIKNFEAIKGKTVAVDALQSGYGFVLYRVLADHGLRLNEDYSVIAVGAGPQRLVAMNEQRAVAAVLDFPEDIAAKAMGYNVLADGTEALGSYEAIVYAARRAWAKAHEADMRAFIRAIVDAHDYIFADKSGTIAELRQRLPNLGGEQAEALYTRFTTGRGGISRKAAIDIAGVKTVLALRSAFAKPKMTLTDPRDTSTSATMNWH